MGEETLPPDPVKERLVLLPDPGKPFDQALLDIYASGFTSGVATILLNQGVPQTLAQHIANQLLSAQAGDPAASDQILARLTLVWSIQGDDPMVGTFAEYTVHRGE